MDEEKTIDEEKTVDEPVEELKEFEPVAFDEVIKESEPERKDAPVLRALGDPDPADMNMIHKHLDNFLAMLCGETPVDSNVRTSTEYWLKRLADGLGGSTKKIYCHPIVLVLDAGNGERNRLSMLIFNNDPTAFTIDTFIEWKEQLYTQIGDTVRLMCAGAFYKGGVYVPSAFWARTTTYENIIYSGGAGDNAYVTYTDVLLKTSLLAFEDGVNAIN